jgi:hypothetical protein
MQGPLCGSCLTIEFVRTEAFLDEKRGPHSGPYDL